VNKNKYGAIHGFETPEFTKEMKKDYTILCPNAFPFHMKFIREVFLMYGFKFELLDYQGKEVIDTGLMYIHNDMCYPAICVSGQQLYALTCGDYDPHKVALLQFQTGGGCRASNYIWILRKALHNMGMGYVPVVSLSFSKVEKSSGFDITPVMLIKGIVAAIYGDLIMLLKNQVKPYEKNKGETQRVIDKWVSEISNQLKNNTGLFGKALKKNFCDIVDDFAAIERLPIKKTKVGIVGEIYVKYSSLGNNGLEDFLESQDCEFMVPGLLAFIQFMFDHKQVDYQLYGGSKTKLGVTKLLGSVTDKVEEYMLDALARHPEFNAPAKFEHLRELGEKIIGRGVKMGEGWLLPAEIAELAEKGYSNVVCAQPFGCLPNHIVAKGTIRTLRNMYPDANITPIDYDAGASKVNQENRIKLMLALAKEKENEKNRT